MKQILILLFFMGLYSCSLKSKSNPQNYYYAGQVLYPDYVHDDTLIVVNPRTLELDLEDCLGSDYEIWYILHKNCAILNMTVGDYQVNVNNYGYTIYDNLDTVRAVWGSHIFEEFMEKVNQ